MLARSPVAGQFELVVGIDDLDDGFFQHLFRHVLDVEPGDLLAAHAPNRACRLGRPEIAAITEQGADHPWAQFLDPAFGPHQGPEQLVQLQPALGIDQHVDNTDVLHVLGDQLVNRPDAGRRFARRRFFRISLPSTISA
jgi:hypothetical protein